MENNKKSLWNFEWFGPFGVLEGVFTATTEEVESVIGKEVSFYDAAPTDPYVNGVAGEIEEGDITLKTDDQEEIEELRVQGDRMGTDFLNYGYNPLEYIEEDYEHLNGKSLWKFHWDSGRMGELTGTFLATEEEVDNVIGTEVYFGEVLGKHSEIYGPLMREEITLVTDNITEIKTLYRLGRKHGFDYLNQGFNPFNYIEEDENARYDPYFDYDY